MHESARQVVHILFGIAIAAFILLAGRARALPVLLIALLAGLILSDVIARGIRVPLVSWLIRDLERPGVLPGKGAIFFVFSATVCLFFFPVQVAVSGVLTLAVLDGVSSLAGEYTGNHRIRNGKSWEGTIAGITAAAVVLSLLVTPFQALVVSIFAGLAELFSPVDDNLVIAPVACLVLTAMS